MSEVSVMFQCNDPDNGRFTGHVQELHIYPFDLQIEADAAPGPRFHMLGNAVKVGRRKFPVIGGIREWVGNWCWNEARMDADVVADMVFYLQCRDWPGSWSFRNGPEDIAKLWEARHAIDLRRMLPDYQGEKSC